MLYEGQWQWPLLQPNDYVGIYRIQCGGRNGACGMAAGARLAVFSALAGALTDPPQLVEPQAALGVIGFREAFLETVRWTAGQ